MSPLSPTQAARRYASSLVNGLLLLLVLALAGCFQAPKGFDGLQPATDTAGTTDTQPDGTDAVTADGQLSDGTGDGALADVPQDAAADGSEILADADVGNTPSDVADLSDVLPGDVQNGDTAPDTSPVVSCVVYVNQNNPTPGDGLSWATAKTDIASAITATNSRRSDLMAPFCEVWVAQGHYYIYDAAYSKPNLSLESATITLEGKIHLYGGFNGTETQRDQRDWDKQPTELNARDTESGSNRVTRIITLESNTVLDGFYLSGISGNGAAVTIADSANVLIENCRFIGNSSNSGGGAIQISNSGNITIRNSIFTNQAALPGSTESTISADLTGPLLIDRCLFQANAGATTIAVIAGVATGAAAGVTIQNTILASNSGTGDLPPIAAFTGLSNITIENSVIIGNRATTPGCIGFSDVGEVAINQTTMYENRRLFDALKGTVSLRLTNSIIEVSQADSTFLPENNNWSGTTSNTISDVALPTALEGAYTDDDAGFGAAEVESGGLTWSSVEYNTTLRQTEFTVNGTLPVLPSGALFVVPNNSGTPSWYAVATITKTKVTVWGDLTAEALENKLYKFVSLFPSGTLALGNADPKTATATDLLGKPRPNTPSVGAYEAP